MPNWNCVYVWRDVTPIICLTETVYVWRDVRPITCSSETVCMSGEMSHPLSVQLKLCMSGEMWHPLWVLVKLCVCLERCHTHSVFNWNCVYVWRDITPIMCSTETACVSGEMSHPLPVQLKLYVCQESCYSHDLFNWICVYVGRAANQNAAIVSKTCGCRYRANITIMSSFRQKGRHREWTCASQLKTKLCRSPQETEKTITSIVNCGLLSGHAHAKRSKTNWAK